jgi:hypothetical protein
MFNEVNRAIVIFCLQETNIAVSVLYKVVNNAFGNFVQSGVQLPTFLKLCST